MSISARIDIPKLGSYVTLASDRPFIVNSDDFFIIVYLFFNSTTITLDYIGFSCCPNLDRSGEGPWLDRAIYMFFVPRFNCTATYGTVEKLAHLVSRTNCSSPLVGWNLTLPQHFHSVYY